MNKETNQNNNQGTLTNKEKQEWVEAINLEAKTDNKPIYKVCEAYGLPLYHYYNWQAAMLKRQFSGKRKRIRRTKAQILADKQKETLKLLSFQKLKNFKLKQNPHYHLKPKLGLLHAHQNKL
jgi:hypothetical protein